MGQQAVLAMQPVPQAVNDAGQVPPHCMLVAMQAPLQR
jgi:hypothetical protein